jgi:acetylornithine deacetylase/succinyl-diaminopimelate desuccinylase-like protein
MLEIHQPGQFQHRRHEVAEAAAITLSKSVVATHWIRVISCPRLDGSGTDPKARAILLLAHIDVVRAKREDWTRDPFVLVAEDGYFYGRGSSA